MGLAESPGRAAGGAAPVIVVGGWMVHRPAADEPAALVCDPSRAAAELGWKPRRTDLDDIVAYRPTRCRKQQRC